VSQVVLVHKDRLVVHCFSARLSGLHNDRKKLNEALREDASQVILGHTIALDPTLDQAGHFRRACGTKRYASNWSLAEWQRMHKAGGKPSMPVIKSRRNAYRKAELPWSYDVTRCAGGQAIMDLGAAFANFLRDCKKPRNQWKFRYPRLKRKALNEYFALWNDQFDVAGKGVRIAKLGWVRQRCVTAAS
jgi:putative transposase